MNPELFPFDPSASPEERSVEDPSAGSGIAGPGNRTHQDVTANYGTTTQGDRTHQDPSADEGTAWPWVRSDQDLSADFGTASPWVRSDQDTSADLGAGTPQVTITQSSVDVNQHGSEKELQIRAFDYELPDGAVAKYPLSDRDQSRLLVWKEGQIEDRSFSDLSSVLPEGAMLIFNNTRVIKARLHFFKSTGARIEVFCLEPTLPHDYVLSFASTKSCRWKCIVGNLKRWKDGILTMRVELEDGNMGRWENGKMGRWEDGNMGRWENGKMGRWGNGKMGRWEDGEMGRWEDGKMGKWEDGKMGRWEDGKMGRWEDGKMGKWENGEKREVVLKAQLMGKLEGGVEVEFSWDHPEYTFSEILEAVGNIPIPPYLHRDSEEIDATVYQTIYSKIKGSVAAPTAGLHFTSNVFENLIKRDITCGELTLHVGAGTFQPVKSDTIWEHRMHTEHFVISKELIDRLIVQKKGCRDDLNLTAHQPIDPKPHPSNDPFTQRANDLSNYRQVHGRPSSLEPFHTGVQAQESPGSEESWHMGVQAQESPGSEESWHMGMQAQESPGSEDSNLWGIQAQRETCSLEPKSNEVLAQGSRGKEPMKIFAVGTTSVRTLESLYWIGCKILEDPEIGLQELVVKQWDPYHSKCADSNTVQNDKDPDCKSGSVESAELAKNSNLVLNDKDPDCKSGSAEVQNDKDPDCKSGSAYWKNEQTIGVTEALLAISGYLERRNMSQLETSTQIIILPGYRFRVIDGLVTNFHQPQSTLLLLISAILGSDWRRVYDHALSKGYRFLSYGDANLYFCPASQSQPEKI